MSKFTRATLVLAIAGLLAPAAVQAQAINEGFENINSLVTWDFINMSNPLGSIDYFQGNSAVFPAQAGTATSYLAVNFNSGGGLATISNWAIIPERTLSNGDTLSFWTRTVTNNSFPDRLQVRMSLNGSSNDVGTDEFSVGDFTTLLLDINPNYSLNVNPGPPSGNPPIVDGYPHTWTQYTITLAGIGAPTNGRLAFRYFMENAGPFGDNSNYIGIDSLVYTPVPEPASLALLGLGALTLIRRRR